MPGRPPRWLSIRFENGIQEFELSSWRYFADFVRVELVDFPQFIYRGQASSFWPLEPSLDRLLKGRTAAYKESARLRHLEAFKLAARGRRGVNPAKLIEDNEWWALGQHQGLATPLLDWTASPFVAAYFAYEDVLEDEPPRRAVYAIDSSLADRRSKEIRAKEGEEKTRTVEFIRPMQDENSRLVSQGGLFSRAPDGETMDGWINWAFTGEKRRIALIKITLPNSDRSIALRELNRMNINRSALFPDLAGASAFCNMLLRVPKY